MFRARIEGVAVRKAASMPEKRSQNNDERKRPKGSTDGDSLRRVGIAASLHVVPYFSGADKDENERPVCPDNGNRIEGRTPVVHKKESADRDKNDREDERNSRGLVVLGHGRPPLSCTTHPKEK